MLCDCPLTTAGHVPNSSGQVGNDESAVYIKKELVPEDEAMEISFEDLLLQEKKMGDLQRTPSNPLDAEQ